MLDPFAPLTAFLDGVAERFGVPACDCAVTLHGEQVYRHSAGFSDPEGKIPVSSTDTYWIYSATKLTTCVSALRLVDEGKLSLEDPVEKYLPEFGQVPVKVPFDGVEPLKTRLTVRRLMNMTGGLDYDLSRPGLAAIWKNALLLPMATGLTGLLLAALHLALIAAFWAWIGWMSIPFVFLGPATLVAWTSWKLFPKLEEALLRHE